MSTIDLYFDRCHNQPYCFFHEETFRYRLSTGELPQYLILAVIAMASRFSLDPFYNNHGRNSTAYASKAWEVTLEKSFDSETGADYRLVQAATLIAIHDFTACKHGKAWIKIGFAVSMAQAFHMMTEPSAALPFSAQEERRRTLWSIYLLDKLATSGRYRPSLFLDRTITLHLPSSEAAFQASIPEKVATLEEFPSLDDSEIENMKSSPAPTIALASTLNAVTCYAFQHNKGGEQKLPWEHTSEYQAICSQLTRFESFFDCFGNMQENILRGPASKDGNYPQVSESTIFSYVLYLVCHCLLQHPFLLRRRLENSKLRTPTSFLAKAIEGSSKSALELTRTLKNARCAQYKISATFLNYAALVAGSIHSLFQHSTDGFICVESIEGVQDCLAHLNEKARYWPNSGRMTTALIEFSEKSAPFSSLLDPNVQTVPLESADIDLLYSLCDYGTMSTDQNPDLSHESGAASAYNHGTPGAHVQAWNTAVKDRDLSGHMDGILPQMFGYTDAQTMIDNFSAALGQY
ncbi:hypothetical protein SVAN01_02329 [Stagonosporopsis vannaccii]|nr:hypothetical protein SVAN01_02329 [Stagonosporopsis vannaccii]